MGYSRIIFWIVRILTWSVAILVLLGLLAHVWLSRDSKELALKHDDEIRVATYNVHYIAASKEVGAWSLGDWNRRKVPLSLAVEKLQADIIGFQEMETFRWPDGSDENLTLDWLLAKHPEYTAGAVGKPTEFPSTQPIFYRHDRFNLINHGWFFFSETPDIIYSRTYNGSFPAFASWVELEEVNSGTVFKVVNLHTDFASYSNRRQSLELVRERITPWLQADEAVLVIGDFNAWHGSRLQRIIADTGLTFAPVTASTYHFNYGVHLFPAIDNIAYTSNFSLTNSPVVLQQKFNDEWPTDHHPVVVDLQF